jgi:hypothetical protein
MDQQENKNMNEWIICDQHEAPKNSKGVVFETNFIKSISNLSNWVSFGKPETFILTY